MKNKVSGHILKAAVIAALMINLFIAARSGWHMGIHALYTIWGVPAEAVVEKVLPYAATIREPKPVRYSPRFRGLYHFNVTKNSGEPILIQGRFDTNDFIGSSDQQILTGDGLSIKYLSFHPSWSRPQMALGAVKLFIAGCFFAASSFLSAMFILILFKMPLLLNPNQRRYR